MPTLTTADKTLLRAGPPVVEYFLALMPQRVVFECDVNKASADWGTQMLQYDGAIGDWQSTTINQTILVYSSTGVYKGRARLREITDTYMMVARTYEFQWRDDDHLKMIEVFDAWTRPTAVGVRADDTLEFFKDSEITYPGASAAQLPKANAGVPFAGFLDANGNIDVEMGTRWSGGCKVHDSFANACGATLDAFSWALISGTLPSGVAISGTIDTPGVSFRFTGTGFGWAELTVTDSGGAEGVHRVPIWIFDDDNPPFRVCTVKRRSQDVRGATVTLEAFTDGLTEDDVPEGCQAALFAREYIDGELVTTDLGCPFPGRAHIKMCGWLDDEATRWNYDDGTVTFSLKSISHIADQMPGYSTFVKDVTAGSGEDWHTVECLTVRNAIAFLLEWHTTLNQILYIECETEETIPGRQFKVAPPLRQIEDAFLGERGVFAELGVSRWGSMHIRYDPQLLNAAMRAARETVLDLASGEWTSDALLKKAHRWQLSSILGGGIAYDPPTATAVLSRAPGKVGLEAGRPKRTHALIVEGQSDLNAKMGRLLGKLATPWTDLPIETWYDVFDPALQEYLSLTVTADENPRGLELSSDDLWIIRELSIEDSPHDAPEVTLKAERLENAGFQGVTVPIPDLPDIPIPDPPPPPPPGDIIPPAPVYTEAIVVSTAAYTGGQMVAGAGICVCPNPASPEWYGFNGGFPVINGDVPLVDCVRVDPNATRDVLMCLAWTAEWSEEWEFDGLKPEIWAHYNWANSFEAGSQGAWIKVMSYEYLATEFDLDRFHEMFVPEIAGIFPMDIGDDMTRWVAVVHHLSGEEAGYDTYTTRIFISDDEGESWSLVPDLCGGYGGYIAWALFPNVAFSGQRGYARRGHGGVDSIGARLYLCAECSGSAGSLGRFRQLNTIDTSDLGGGWAHLFHGVQGWAWPVGGTCRRRGTDLVWSPVDSESTDLDPSSSYADNLVNMYYNLASVMLVYSPENILGCIPMSWGAWTRPEWSTYAFYSSIAPDFGLWRVPYRRDTITINPSEDLEVVHLVHRTKASNRLTRVYAPSEPHTREGCTPAAYGVVGSPPQYEFEDIYATIEAHPGTEGYLVIGRSSLPSDGLAENANELIHWSENLGVAWANINGTGGTGLFELGARGITGIAIVAWEID